MKSKSESNLKRDVQHGHVVVVFQSHGVCLNVVQANSAIPRGNQEELSGVRPKLHRRNGIGRRILQFELCAGFHFSEKKEHSFVNKNVKNKR